jgi:hypothetical protein
MTWYYWYLPRVILRLVCARYGHLWIVHYDSSGHCRRCAEDY